MMSLQRFSTSVANEAELARMILRVGRLADELGFNAGAKSMVMTAASELGRNMLKYADGGQLAASPLVSDRGKGIEITARDRGPGIEDVEQAMQDAFSSGGTLGMGLPGVQRMMDEFHIETAPEKGTTVTVRKWG